MQYEQGMWNVNTVIMGGLGGDPHSSGSSSEEGNCACSILTKLLSCKKGMGAESSYSYRSKRMVFPLMC